MLEWHKNKDVDLEIRAQSDNTPVLAIIYSDLDWRCNILLPGGVAHLRNSETPKSLAQAKRECEVAALKLRKMREYFESMEGKK